MNRYLLFAITAVLGVAACQKMKTKSAAVPEKIDACSLITKDEVQKIQGQPVIDVKPSENADDNFRYSQCFYTTQVSNESVSLAVTQRNPASAKARDPKTFWKDTFGPYEGKMKESEGDEEKRKGMSEDDDARARPPQKIKGLGEGAWWSAGRMGGSIYVLKDNVMIRVSVGGPENEESRIAKTRALAEIALSRF